MRMQSRMNLHNETLSRAFLIGKALFLIHSFVKYDKWDTTYGKMRTVKNQAANGGFLL